MLKQLETPAAVEAAKANYVATGQPEAWVRYEAALRDWLFRPRVGSQAWHDQRNRKPPGAGPIAAAPPTDPAPIAPAGVLVAAE